MQIPIINRPSNIETKPGAKAHKLLPNIKPKATIFNKDRLLNLSATRPLRGIPNIHPNKLLLTTCAHCQSVSANWEIT
ncbi:Uncharacterised protein [Legionella pneumophila]|nr:Uncharacterised protein [Legionella pneumophila]